MTTVSDKTAQSAERPRRTGVARVSDVQAYQIASLTADAAREASRLCDQIERAVYGAYFSKDEAEPYAADMATSSDIRDKAQEARTLLQMALTYLNTLPRNAADPLR